MTSALAMLDDADTPNLATLRERAENCPQADRQEAWAAYWAKQKAEEARRDRARKLHAAGARALAERVGRLPGVAVELAEADDFGRAELRLVFDNDRRWTRPVDLRDARGYSNVRDAIAAYRRGDHRRAIRWLSCSAPPRSTVRWYGIEQVRFNRTESGWEPRW